MARSIFIIIISLQWINRKDFFKSHGKIITSFYGLHRIVQKKLSVNWPINRFIVVFVFLYIPSYVFFSSRSLF